MDIVDLLPFHITLKIFDQLETKERARLCLISKRWRESLLTSWNRIHLSFSSLAELEDQRRWLDMIARKEPKLLHTFSMHWAGGRLLHPAAGKLHIENFFNLKCLNLRLDDQVYWPVNAGTLQKLTQLKKLEELAVAFTPTGHTHMSDVINLEQFSGFEKLKSLSIVLYPNRGWEIGWQVSLSESLEGLKLKTLHLFGVSSLEVNATLKYIVYGLENIILETKQPLSEEILAPQLRTVSYSCVNSKILPFQASLSLSDIIYNGDALPVTSIVNYKNLQKVYFQHYLQSIDNKFISNMLTLTLLQELKVAYYNVSGLVETLEIFTYLPRLQVLHLALMLSESTVIQPTSRMSKMYDLRELKLQSFQIGSVYLEGLGGCTLNSYPSLVNFEHLECLHLKLVPEMQGCSNLIKDLKSLLKLKELSIIKGYVTCPKAIIRNQISSQSRESTGTFEQMLFQLKSLKTLEVLQVAAINDNLNLNRVLIPDVKHFDLACRSLSICPSCLPWGNLESIQLSYVFASPYSTDLLNQLLNISWAHENVLGMNYNIASKNADSAPTKFGDNLFADWEAEAYACVEKQSWLAMEGDSL